MLQKYPSDYNASEIFYLLIDAGANPNLQSKEGVTALMIVAENDDFYRVERLIKAGADLNLRNDNECTALMIAANYSNTESTFETVKLLVGADLNLQDNDGWTALMLAARYSNTESTFETVKLLVESRADLNLQNNDGWTALMLAVRYSNTESTFETVKLLVESGADLNLHKSNMYTALMLAARYSNAGSTFETVKLLVESGADLNLQNDAGRTALMIASEYSDTESTLETVELIVKAHEIDKNIYSLHNLGEYYKRKNDSNMAKHYHLMYLENVKEYNDSVEKTLSYLPNQYIFDFLIRQKTKTECLEEKNGELTDENEELKLLPGGKLYQEAMTDFYDRTSL